MRTSAVIKHEFASRIVGFICTECGALSRQELNHSADGLVCCKACDGVRGTAARLHELATRGLGGVRFA